VRNTTLHKVRILGGPISLLGILLFLAPAAKSQQAQGAGDESQQNQSSEPIPAYHSPLNSGSEGNGGQQESQAATQPLSGAQYLSLGNLKTSRSYWQPFFNFEGTADSNAAESTSNATWGSWDRFLVGVDVHHISGVSQLTLSYIGGGMYSNQSYVSSGAVQELGIDEQISFRRATLSLIDQASYAPESMLGQGGVAGAGGISLAGIGTTSTGLQSGFVNGQSILTGGAGQNLSNSSVAQLNTFLTPRASFTVAGGYSLLHFFGNNLIDSGEITFQGGYNYQLSQHNTLALLYAFNQFRFGDSGQLTGTNSAGTRQSFNTHSAEASFGRQVTDRFAFQVAGGPEFTVVGGTGAGVPTGGSGATGMGSTTQLGWTAKSSLSYQYRRSALGLTYFHGVTAGSGVFTGASSDTVSGTLTRRMSRAFSSSFTGGYSRNSGLGLSGLPTADLGLQSSSQTFGYWFAGTNVALPLSETLALTLSYQLNYQNSSSTFCIGTSCGSGVLVHFVSVGLSWSQHPLLF
jgi:hypothetical protein